MCNMCGCIHACVRTQTGLGPGGLVAPFIFILIQSPVLYVASFFGPWPSSPCGAASDGIQD